MTTLHPDFILTTDIEYITLSSDSEGNTFCQTVRNGYASCIDVTPVDRSHCDAYDRLATL